MQKTSTTQKGTITFTYDAAGNKLKKITVDNGTTGKTITTTTTYIAGFVYESRTTFPTDANNPDYIDVLQFLGHEEGRIRRKTDGTFTWDYFLKDHLGNVRMVLTEESKTDMYPAATMEAASAATEELLYANLPATRVDVPTALGYPTNTPSGNLKVAKVTGTAGGTNIGPAITLKVMAGDKFNLTVNSWWKSTNTPGTPVSIVNSLVSALTGGIPGASGGKVSGGDLTSSGLLPGLANDFLNTQTYTSGKPKAYVNWVLFNEQFEFVGTGSGAEQVDLSNVYKSHTKTNLSVTMNGYLYVYVSNATPNIDVFFDNLQVTHIKGTLLEETHYYPFGLTMAGISSKAAGGIQNRFKFNDGTELQSGEFSDGSGLELYATNFRSLDPQLGRFWQIDPLAQALVSLSPYQFANDNPIYFNDPYGLLSDSLHPVVLPTVTVTAKVKHDNTSAWQLGVKWLSGKGPRTHHFKDGDQFTKMLQKHDHIQDTRSQIVDNLTSGSIVTNKPYTNNYGLSGLSGVPKYIRDYSTLMTGGLTGNLAVTFLGSYGLKYEVVSIDEQSGTAEVRFYVSNSSTIESATHPPVIGYTQFWSKNIGQPLNNYFSSGAMSKTTQTVEWKETIKWK